MSTAIHAKTQLTLEQYRLSYAYHAGTARTIRWMLFILSILAAIVGYVFFWVLGFPHLAAALLLVPVPVCLLLNPTDVKDHTDAALERQFEKGPLKNKKVSWRIDEDGITPEMPGSEETHLWKYLHAIKETPEGFLVYPRDSVYYWWPTSAFESDEAVKQFRQLARSHGKHIARIKEKAVVREPEAHPLADTLEAGSRGAQPVAAAPHAEPAPKVATAAKKAEAPKSETVTKPAAATTTAADSVGLKCRMTFAEFFRSQKYHAVVGSWESWRLFIASMVLAAAGYFVLWTSGMESLAAACILFPAFVCFLTNVGQVKLRPEEELKKVFDMQRFKEQDFSWTVSRAGFDYVAGTDKALFTWSDIQRVVETPDGFLVYTGKDDYFWFPHTAFESTAGIEQFRGQVRAARVRCASIKQPVDGDSTTPGTGSGAGSESKAPAKQANPGAASAGTQARTAEQPEAWRRLGLALGVSVVGYLLCWVLNWHLVGAALFLIPAVVALTFKSGEESAAGWSLASVTWGRWERFAAAVAGSSLGYLLCWVLNWHLLGAALFLIPAFAAISLSSPTDGDKHTSAS